MVREHAPGSISIAEQKQEIFEKGFLQPQLLLSFGLMEVLVDEEQENIEDQITYLYK
jgi:hypothetical protein